MTTYSPTAPRTRFDHLRAHLGTYVAGVGVTAALTAGALVAFLSVATFVAFNDFLFGGSSDDAGAAYLESSVSGAPTAAAAALGTTRGAVAEDPVAGPNGTSAGPGSMAAGSGGSGPNKADASGKVPSAGGPTGPGTSSPPPDVASPPIVIPSLLPTTGPVTDGVGGVDNTAGTNLSGPSRGATRAVDGAGTGALDRAGRAAGRPRLGTQAGGAVSGITGSALGG